MMRLEYQLGGRRLGTEGWRGDESIPRRARCKSISAAQGAGLRNVGLS